MLLPVYHYIVPNRNYMCTWWFRVTDICIGLILSIFICLSSLFLFILLLFCYNFHVIHLLFTLIFCRLRISTAFWLVIAFVSLGTSPVN